MKSPKLSIVSATYNDSQFAPALYSSIQQQLEKAEWEWIIVNDGSDEPHANQLHEFAKERPCTLLTIKNSGPAIARDVGIAAAKSDVVQVIDVDDIALVENIELGLQKQQECQLDIVVGDCIEFYEDGTEDHYWQRGPIDVAAMIHKNQWIISNLFTKSIWETVGGFTTKQEFPTEDYVFWTKCIAAGATLGYINLPLIRYRRKALGSRNSKKRSYDEKLQLRRALHPHQKEIIESNFGAEEKKQLLAVVNAKRGYYETQSGNFQLGIRLLKKSISDHPNKGRLAEILLKSIPKRLLKKGFGIEL